MKLKNASIAALAMLLVVVVTACGQTVVSPTPGPTTEPTLTRPANWPQTLYYAQAGGSIKIMALKLAELIPRYVDVKILNEPVAGANEGTNRLVNGDYQIAGLPPDLAYNACMGEDKFADSPKGTFRTLLLAHESVLFMVTRADSGIKSIADLKGKRVQYGAPRFQNTEAMWNEVFKVAGVDPKSVFQLPPEDKTEMAAALVEKKIDAALWSGGYPDSTLMETMKTTPMHIIPLTAQEGAVLPNYLYSWSAIPADAYPGQSEDIMVASSGRNHVSIAADLPDDLVYAMTKAIFEHLSEIQAVHIAFKIITREDALGTKFLRVPAHPGAVKYVTEKGIWSEADVKINEKLLADLHSRLK